MKYVNKEQLTIALSEFIDQFDNAEEFNLISDDKYFRALPKSTLFKKR